MLNRCTAQSDTGIWIRSAYKQGFENETITTVIRRGDRSDPNGPSFVPIGVDIPVRFIKQMGNRAANIQPVLYEDDGTTVRVTHRIVRPINLLTAEDLAGGSPDTATSELVRYHLAVIDNTILPKWEQIVTVYRFKHRPKVWA